MTRALAAFYLCSDLAELAGDAILAPCCIKLTSDSVPSFTTPARRCRDPPHTPYRAKSFSHRRRTLAGELRPPNFAASRPCSFSARAKGLGGFASVSSTSRCFPFAPRCPTTRRRGAPARRSYLRPWRRRERPCSGRSAAWLFPDLFPTVG